jgi:hypothetical protein
MNSTKSLLAAVDSLKRQKVLPCLLVGRRAVPCSIVPSICVEPRCDARGSISVERPV